MKLSSLLTPREYLTLAPGVLVVEASAPLFLIAAKRACLGSTGVGLGELSSSLVPML